MRDSRWRRRMSKGVIVRISAAAGSAVGGFDRSGVIA